MSLNEQFNQHYEEMINTVKSRALWRVGERVIEGQAFRCTCFHCGYESLHQRFDIQRHRLLFGKSIRAIEAPRPMLRCRRCGHQQHLRDVGELVVPSTIALHDELRDLLIAHLDGDTAKGELTDEVVDKIAAFREEASSPVRQHLLSSVAAGASEQSADGAAVLERVGRELFLNSEQVATATSGQSVPDTD